MARVTLLYDRDCPNVREARANLLRAFSEAGVAAQWDEVDRAAADSPPEWRGYGSPAVLVDGRDVAGLLPAVTAATCRTYLDAGVRSKAPPVTVIVAALSSAQSATVAPATIPGTAPPRTMRQFLVAAPGIGMALLPKVACPACWPAYAGVLSSVGLGFLLETRYLLPLTATFVGLALGSLAWRAERRRGLGPLLLGSVAAVVLLVGKFVYEIDAATWVGVSFLVGASLWNAWPRKAAPLVPGCPSCAPHPGASTHPGESETSKESTCPVEG